MSRVYTSNRKLVDKVYQRIFKYEERIERLALLKQTNIQRLHSLLLNNGMDLDLGLEPEQQQEQQQEEEQQQQEQQQEDEEVDIVLGPGQQQQMDDEEEPLPFQQEAEAEADADNIRIKVFEIGNQRYLKSDLNVVYDFDSSEAVGAWDEEEQKIIYYPMNDTDSESGSEYCQDSEYESDCGSDYDYAAANARTTVPRFTVDKRQTRSQAKKLESEAATATATATDTTKTTKTQGPTKVLTRNKIIRKLQNTPLDPHNYRHFLTDLLPDKLLLTAHSRKYRKNITVVYNATTKTFYKCDPNVKIVYKTLQDANIAIHGNDPDTPNNCWELFRAINMTTKKTVPIKSISGINWVYDHADKYCLKKHLWESKKKSVTKN